MNQSLFPSLICALLSVIFLGWARAINEGDFQNVLAIIGSLFAAYACYYGLGYALTHLPGLIYAAGDAMPKILYQGVALAAIEKDRVVAFGGLSPGQVDALMYKTGELVLLLDEKGRPDWSIEMNHRRLSSDWVSQFLYECERYYPDFPPVTAHTDKSKKNMDRIAFRDFLRRTEKLLPRDGMRDLWIDGHSPESVRDMYF